MATRTAPLKETKPPKITKATDTPKAKNDYLELKLPKFPFQLSSTTPLLVLLLIIGAYFLGVQTTKVQYLEEREDTQTLGAVTDPNAPELSPTPVFADVKVGTLPILGEENAKVTIVEFSDFQCPFCKRFADDAFAQIKKEYVDTGKVKIAFRHYPLPIHPNAPKAAEASECANEQDQFWTYHDLLFERQDAWSNLTSTEAQNTFVTYAGELGIETGQFQSCLTSGKYAEKVQEDTDAAIAAGVSATPTAYINGQQVVGSLPFSAFQTIIDEQLN